MGIVSVIGPKGGIGKTTLSINTTAALTRALKQRGSSNSGVCLIDLDLRLPTISSLLDSHPRKTFFDLFNTLANQTYQVDFLRSLYQVLTRFQAHLDGEADEERLARSFGLYKSLNADLFHFSEFEFGDLLHELFLLRGEVHSLQDIQKLDFILKRLDSAVLRSMVHAREADSRPSADEYINYIEEYGFSIIGGEVPVLGKRVHRRRINEPAFLLLFLEFLNQVFDRFEYTLLDTPAGGVNHLSSLMNVIDQVLFVFDLSNSIAVNGSIDALHSFIDYYEDFCADYQAGALTGLDREFASRMTVKEGEETFLASMQAKKFGILFNRSSESREVVEALGRLREYLDTLDKYETYKDRIHIVGLLPNHKVINITNNRGALFYNKDMGLTARMTGIAESILNRNANCPTLASSDKDILKYLARPGGGGFSTPLVRLASAFG
ncbi:MAG: ParA family protein [Nitrospina sp.]|nr:ParA family protein [Nitrospina sp.]